MRSPAKPARGSGLFGSRDFTHSNRGVFIAGIVANHSRFGTLPAGTYVGVWLTRA